MNTRGEVVSFPVPNVVPWPGKRVRDAHNALLRAERMHDKSRTLEDWTEVCHWRDEWIEACLAEGIAP